MSFFKKLLGLAHPKPTQTSKLKKTEYTTSIEAQSTTLIKTNEIPEIITQYREAYKGQSLSNLNDLYFDLLAKLQDADKKGEISNLLMYSQGSLGLLEFLIEFNIKEYGIFRIKTIPAIDKALIYFAVNGNTGQLKNIQDIVNYLKELHSYKNKVDSAFKMRKLASKIYHYVKANPNCQLTVLKKNIFCDETRLISTTAKYMEKAGKLIRKKEGNQTLLNVVEN